MNVNPKNGASVSVALAFFLQFMMINAIHHGVLQKIFRPDIYMLSKMLQ